MALCAAAVRRQKWIILGNAIGIRSDLSSCHVHVRGASYYRNGWGSSRSHKWSTSNIWRCGRCWKNILSILGGACNIRGHRLLLSSHQTLSALRKVWLKRSCGHSRLRHIRLSITSGIWLARELFCCYTWSWLERLIRIQDLLSSHLRLIKHILSLIWDVAHFFFSFVLAFEVYLAGFLMFCSLEIALDFVLSCY